MKPDLVDDRLADLGRRVREANRDLARYVRKALPHGSTVRFVNRRGVQVATVLRHDATGLIARRPDKTVVTVPFARVLRASPDRSDT